MASRSGNRQQANSGGENTAAKPAMRKPIFIKVDQLKPGTSGHNLTVKIVNANTVLSKKPRNPSSLRVPSRPQQNTRIAECLVGDETGSILLTARNEQVDLMKPNATIIIRNAKIDMFKGSMRLAVDKWGRIEAAEPAEPAEPATFMVNEENNLSLVEYELVNVEE